MRNSINLLNSSSSGIPFQFCIQEIEDKYSRSFSFLRNSINILSSSRLGIPFQFCIEEIEDKYSKRFSFLRNSINILSSSRLGIHLQVCIQEIEYKYSKRFSFLRNSINILSSSRLGIPFLCCIQEIEEKGISSLCKNFIKSIISFLLFILERREYEVPQYIEVIFAELGFLFVFKSADLFSKQKIKSYILDLSSSETFILSTLSRNL